MIDDEKRDGAYLRFQSQPELLLDASHHEALPCPLIAGYIFSCSSFFPSYLRAQPKRFPPTTRPSPTRRTIAAGFRGTVETSNWRQSELHGGCLTLGDASVHFDPPPVDFQITDLVSMEKKNLHGLKGFRFKLKNGNKVVFYPLSHDLAAIEKAIRDMASQHGVVLK